MQGLLGNLTFPTPSLSFTFDPARSRHGGTVGGDSCSALLKPLLYSSGAEASVGVEAGLGCDFFLRDRLSF